LTVVDVSLTEGVVYGCTFWVEHVCMITDAGAIMERLERFLFQHLLHWFEAMSILKRSKETIRMLKQPFDWHKVIRHFVHLQESVN
jgi:hypothetical protein